MKHSAEQTAVMDELFQALLFKWNFEDVYINQGANQDRVNAFEEKLNYRLPKDYRSYLSVCDGMQDCELDQNLFWFWSLEKVESESMFLSVKEKESVFICIGERVFFDKFYYLEVFAESQESGRVIAESCGRQTVFESFTCFVENYLNGLLLG